MATRRAFTLGLIGAGAGLTLATGCQQSGSGIAPGVPLDRVPSGGSVPDGARAAGDLAARIALSAERMTGPGVPAFSREFILADVVLDPPRFARSRMP